MCVCVCVVRAAKFVVRKSWVVTGSDDMQVRVYNYNTLEKVSTFEAHTDYIRSIIVHPTHPYILTSSGMYVCVCVYVGITCGYLKKAIVA